jgi:probable phosphoglycerate mutase
MGSWEGLSMEETKRSFPKEYARRGSQLAGFRPPGGESFSDLRNRVVPLFEDLVRQEEGPILIAGHAGVNRVILCHILGVPLENIFRLGQDYGCCNLLRRGEDHCAIQAVNLLPWSSSPVRGVVSGLHTN